MTTLLDVSRRAGVSKTTVSRVMNGKGRISQATRDAVFKAIEELNYRPNILAQSLSNQTTNSVGLILPSGYHSSQNVMEIMDLAHAMARESNKFLIITQTDTNNIESGIRSINQLVDRRCDGILYYKTSHIEAGNGEEQLSSLIDELPIPLVVINYKLADKPNNYVWYDQVEAESLAVNKLLELGHKKIAYICGPMNINTSRQRFEGYKQSLHKSGLEIDPFLIVEASSSFDGGYTACQQLLQRQVEFTAIACHSDAIAIGALKALQQEGIPVPETISIFGFGNDDISTYTNPSISSVKLPVNDIVQRACKMLFKKMENIECNLHLLDDIHGELVLRDSIKEITL
ncbi:LacI family DNA-binding transcriptional regulator [Vibrio natriegens]|uniref:LacI family DNA-binding transcriptional regulator n=1 Tax=Vibrio natriegens TaxID=691 RepID=UPI003F869328